MSYSISKSGKAGEVRKEVEEELGKINYLKDQENEIKEAAGALALQVLDATDPERQVSVSIYGHAEFNAEQKQTKQNVSISIG